MINNKNTIQVSYNIEKKNINIKLDQNERYIKTFKDNQVDATVIKILPKDDIYKDYFLEPELGYDNNNLIGKEIFIPQFPGLKQIQNARGKILEINNDSSNEFTHLAKTQKGSSGSPIFLKGNNKVIGIHKEGSTIKKENYGDFIAPIISILTFDIMLEKMQTNNNISSNPQNNNKIAPGNLNSNNVINVNNNISNNDDISKSKLNQPEDNEIEERYAGELLNGLRHGKGTVYYKKNGKIKYKGDFVNGKYEGFGELYDENGTLQCKGNFKNGKCEEDIKLYYYNGIINYEGQFVNGLKHGKGKKYYENGKIQYEGYFINNKYEGIGKLFYKNGEIKYEGTFKNGKFDEGKGKEYYDDYWLTTIKYEGDFKSGNYEGKGKLFYEKGEIKYEH